MYFDVPEVNVLPSYLIDIFKFKKIITLQSRSFHPFDVDTNKQIKIRYETTSGSIVETQTCSIVTHDKISCPISVYSANVGIEFVIKLSIDNENYEALNRKLYLYTVDTDHSSAVRLKPSTLHHTKIPLTNGKILIEIQIVNEPVPFPTNQIYLRFQDQSLNEIEIGTIANGNITCDVPHFATYNILYPRLLTVDASYDGVHFFGVSQSIQVYGFDTIEFYPKPLIFEQILNMRFLNFPNLTRSIQDEISLKLVSSKNVISLKCTHNISLTCSTPDILNANIDTYSIQLHLNGDRLYLPLISDEISITQPPSITLSTTKILTEMKNVIYLNVSGDLGNLKDSIKIRGNFRGNSIDATIIVDSDRIGFIFGNINSGVQKKSLTKNSLEISYDGGLQFIHFTDIQLIQPFKLTDVIVVGESTLDSKVTYSFQNTTLKLIGENLNGSVIVKLANEPTFSHMSIIENTQSDFITIVIPEFKYYTPSIPFTFPIAATIGVSLNDGTDFATIPITIANKFSPIYLVDIDPSVGERKHVNISMRVGSNSNTNVKYCVFKENQTKTIKIPPIQIGIDLFCPLFPDSFKSSSEIFIALENKFNDTSDFQKFIFVKNPFPRRIYPDRGDAVGNYYVTITGEFDTRLEHIYLQIKDVKAPDPCIILNSSAIICKVISNGAQSIEFELSYNRIEWYKTNSNFTFLPCDPGYDTSSYQEDCQPCDKGKFKSSFGIEVCTNCLAGTFTDKVGSTNCTKCPEKMKSPKDITGLSSVSQCVCQNNTMVHPITKTCIDCPEGAICNGENVTFPKSQIGWWFSKDDITIFYQCYPIIRCMPDTPNNCTKGYEGIRCGACADGFYKSKLFCKPCNDATFTALSLVGAGIIGFLIMVIAGLFVLITSTKISQMTSISITFGYWQIISTFSVLDLNWPWSVDTTLSVAQASNFNFDFLAPECIFRIIGLKYNYYYVYFTQISMPFVFLIAFIVIYLLILLRSLFALVIGSKIANCLRIKYFRLKPEKRDSVDRNAGKFKKLTQKIVIGIKKVIRTLLSGLVWIRNFIVWSFREKSSRNDLQRILNKIIGAYLSFISFFFLRIMTTSFQIFGCDYQPNGIYSFKESPDITCYRDIWFIFLPLSVISIVLFGIGSILYFTILIIQYRRLEKSETFLTINKFTLSKYKKKFFFWDLFDSIRKALFSVLTIFFKPMFLITVGIAIIFIGMMLQVQFIPYRKKFHNLMDYFILMSTLLTLFAGLLLFVVDNNGGTQVVIDPGLRDIMSRVLPIITIILIIGSNVVVIGMFLFDVYIRRKKENKKIKTKIENNVTKVLVTDDPQMVSIDNERDFQFSINFQEDSDDEDQSTSMNQILEDVFSLKRIKKNVNDISNSGKSAAMKFARKVRLDRVNSKFSSRVGLIDENRRKRTATVIKLSEE